MIVGNFSIFAIESAITHAYEQRSFQALGFFVIHVGGRRYGVCKSDATMLACSYGEVTNRIAARGKHAASFAAASDAGKIADAFKEAIYAEKQHDSYFGIPVSEFRMLFSKQSHNLMWAPDGDEAFDDGSYVLQFDVNDLVRLIAFKCQKDYHHDPQTLSDVWLPANEYYRILQEWLESFESEWQVVQKR